MSLLFSNTHHYRTLRSLLAGMLVFGTFFISVPAPLVLANEVVDAVSETVSADDEGGSEETPQEASEPVGDDGAPGEAGEDGEPAGDEAEVVEEGAGSDGTQGDAGEDATEPESEAGEPQDDGTVTTIQTGNATATADTVTVTNTNGTGVDATEGDGGAPIDQNTKTSSSDSSTSTTHITPAGTTTHESSEQTQSTSGGGSSSSDTTSASSTTKETDEGVESTSEDLASSTEKTLVKDTASTTVAADNTATTTSESSVEVGTGANIARNVGGTAIVDTGDAVAVANVITMANTNIVNSQGLVHFLNLMYGEGSIDLRDEFDLFDLPSDTTAQSTCSLLECTDRDASLEIYTDNTANIFNDVFVRSQTGGNVAAAGPGGAYVSTGNSYAAANVINLANTNFVDSNYLLVGINNFGDLEDDIIFPGLDVFERMMGSRTVLGNAAVATDNTAAVANNLGVIANTGDNEAVGTYAGVLTGDATANAAITNQVNQNFFNSDSVYILVRVFGDWDGELFGLPPGLVWEHTPEGIVIKTDPATGPSPLAGGADLTSETRNNATINNDVQVYALTGDNKAQSDGGDALIATGDAYAAANVFNVANTNVVGRNWVTAVFNIFGDFDGNISFGQPDLWIGGSAEATEGGFTPGKEVEYTFTVTNFGDAVANDVVIRPSFESEFLAFEDAATDPEDPLAPGEDEPIAWNIGSLAPGESKEVTKKATISRGTLLNPQTSVVLNANVRAHEGDANYDDNEEEVTLVVSNGALSRSGGSVALRLGDPELLVSKRALTEGPITPSSTVTYELTIENRGDHAFHTLLTDTIYGPSGRAIYKQEWELDTIYADEEIYITYDVFYNASSTPGVYTNRAVIEGIGNNPSLDKVYGKFFTTEPAEAEVRIVGVGEVVEEAAAPTPAVCDAYLTKDIEWGADNDPVAVAKLQQFLKTYEGYEVAVTGEYDAATYAAVRSFQSRYASEILYPWGITSPTGFVYHTTKRQVNYLYCQGAHAFPLTPEQLSEIDTFKAKTEDESVLDELGNTVGRVEGNSDPFAVAVPPRSSIERRAPSNQTANAMGAFTTIELPASRTLGDRLRTRLDRFMQWLSQGYQRVVAMTIGETVEGKEVD